MSEDKKPQKKGFKALFKRNPNAINSYGITRLQVAVRDCNVKKVDSLLKAGAYPDFTGRYGQDFRPLGMAVRRRYAEISEKLLKAGAKPNDYVAGRSYLSLAVMQRAPDLLLLLLNHNADIHLKDTWSEDTPLFHVHDFDYKMADILVGRGLNINARNYQGKTALYDAVCKEKYRLARRLLSLGADPKLHPQDSTSLMQLVLENSRHSNDPLWEMLPLLMRHGANPDSCDSNGRNVFMHAILHQDMMMIQSARLYCKNLLQRDYNGNTPLHHALSLHETETIHAVLDVYGRQDYPQEPNNKGLTAMSFLIEDRFYNDGKSEKVKTVIERMLRMGADPNSCDSHGRGLAHLAVLYRDHTMLETLISYKTDLDRADQEGDTPLTIAVKARNLDIVDRLLDAGASPNITNDKGWTILDLLSRGGDRTSPLVQRLMAAGGQYVKQLPANDHAQRPHMPNPAPRTTEILKPKTAPFPKKH